MGSGTAVEWLAPSSLEEALALRASRGADTTVVAGGSFLAILMNQGFVQPTSLLSLGGVGELRGIAVVDGELRLGAMVRHRDVERDPVIRRDWPVLALGFGLVASPRVRNQATVGGVLADADYASDPPAVLCAVDARAVLRSPRGERHVPIDELILGFYETCIAEDELLTEVRVPAVLGPAVYRKFRSRSSEDRPCVAVAAARSADRLRVVVGACADVPQHYPDVCAKGSEGPIDAAVAREIGSAYAQRMAPLSDSRGSAEYRRRVVAVEVRRAVEMLGSDSVGNGGGGRGAGANR
ncbi:MAG: FAD binding domain-containing protein [Solirubrobacterales bacterium]|nr:FAD binding domain-containing protein [Solirubrobacterales bacterium]